jgi:hypothetical protein
VGKGLVFVTWSLLVGGVAYAVQRALDALGRVSGARARLALTALAGIAPVLLNDWLLVSMAPGLRAMAARLSGAWHEPALAQAVQSDYLNFLRVVGFLAPLLSTSVLDALVDALRAGPQAVLPSVAANAPRAGAFFQAYVLLRAAQALAEATGVLRVALAAAAGALGRAQLRAATAPPPSPPPPTSQPVAAAWAGYVHLVTVTFAPIAPCVTLASLAFFHAAALAAAVLVSSVERAPYDTRGALALVAAAQLADNVAIGAAVQAVLLGASASGSAHDGAAALLAIAPLALLVAHFRGRIGRRQADGLHGRALRGRLPLALAAAVDAARPAAHVRAQLRALGRDLRAWAPPCAPQRLAPRAAADEGADAVAEVAAGRGAAARSATQPAGEPFAPPPRRAAAEAASAAEEGDAARLPFEPALSSQPSANEARAAGPSAEARLEALQRWLRRYERADAMAYRPYLPGSPGSGGGAPSPLGDAGRTASQEDGTRAIGDAPQ